MRLAGQSSAGTGSPRVSRASRAARALAQASASPVWWATVAAIPVASHATAGRLGDASAATEIRVSSASTFRFDHSSDQPMSSRAAMRRSGSEVSVSTLPANSRTQSACPAGRARSAAASSRRALLAGGVGGGQVPGVAVGLVAERVRDHQVRRGALGERDGMVDGRADQRMGEPRTRPVHADQARRLRRGQSAGGEPGHCRGGQVRAVGDRGEQQGGPGRPGQGGEPGGHDGGQLAGQREGLISPQTPRGRVGRDDLRQLDQGQRVPGCLGEHLLTGPAAWRSRLGVEEPPGFRRAQRRQP